MAEAPATGKISPAGALAVIYGIFGALWIVLSDATVAMLVRDPDVLTLVQTSKGWLFVALSALLILVAGSRLIRALQASDQRYRLLFADNPQPMMVYDPATFRFMEINRSAGRVLGYSAEDLVNTPVLDILVPEDRPRAHAIMEKARTVEDAHDTVLSVVCKNGRVMQAETRTSSVYFAGRVARLVAINDITARVQAEGALIRTLDRLARHETDRSQLARVLAHDTREPLRQVASFIQLLERRYGGNFDEDAKQYVAFATEGIHRLNALLSDLQRFTEAGPVEYDRTDMAEVMAGVLHIMQPRLDTVEASICIGELPTLPTDRRNLAVVFQCLIDNAIKFRHPTRPCRIEIGAELLGMDWRFSVKDNGIGIEPEYRDAIFTLFARLHTRDRIPGNGTGLALARKLIEAMGGRIWAEDTPDDGALFRFTLPAHLHRATDIDM